MKYRYLFLLLLMIHCGNEPDDEDTPLTSFPMITGITFGTVWNASESTVNDTGRTFDDDSISIYYEVKFEESLLRRFMIKKKWEYNNDSLFVSVVPLKIDDKRVCGEFRSYDSNNLDTGTYEMSIFVLDTCGTYKPAQYDGGVVRTFTMQ